MRKQNVLVDLTGAIRERRTGNRERLNRDKKSSLVEGRN